MTGWKDGIGGCIGRKTHLIDIMGRVGQVGGIVGGKEHSPGLHGGQSGPGGWDGGREGILIARGRLACLGV